MSHFGLLLLFPVDSEYEYIVKKYFDILYYKKIEITIEDFQQLFRIDCRHEEEIIISRSQENFGDGKLIFFLFRANSVEHVNENLKKKARREIDNMRYIKTGIDRLSLPLQNHLHTTDNSDQLIKSVNYLKCINKIDNLEHKQILSYINKSNYN